MAASRRPPFVVAHKVTEKEEETSDKMTFEKQSRPKNRYIPRLAPTPMKETFGKDISMSDYLMSNQYFGDIHSCPDIILLPEGPPYMTIHLRTIAKHFSDPSCYITTDEAVCRHIPHLLCLPSNYPWIFMIDVYEPKGRGLELISRRHFFRDLEGEIGKRPYVEITNEESLAFVNRLFEEEKARTGMWICKGEAPWGHFEHWGRQYIVRFLKKKTQPTPDLSMNSVARRGWSWSNREPIG